MFRDSLHENIFESIISATQSKILCCVLKIIFNVKTSEKSENILKEILTQIQKHIEICLADDDNSLVCALNFIEIHNSTLSSAEKDIWKDFSSKLLVTCVQKHNEGDAIDVLVNEIVSSIQSSKISPYFKSVATYLSESAAIKTFQALVGLIFHSNIKSFGKIDQNLIDMVNQALSTLPERRNSINLRSVLSEKDLSKLLVYSLEQDNHSLLELSYKLYLVSPSPNLLENRSEEENCQIMKKLLAPSDSELDYRNKFSKILLQSDASLRNLFIKMVADGDVVLSEDHHSDVCQLVVITIKLSQEKLPKKFSK